ncbi:MAG TPA: WD40 repeat domain-containing protein, partial [Candidatus Paceibacterota bacterium]|nr:WD40 repeat domain-containing protein [Candidatus Paceibacterota bacterium]
PSGQRILTCGYDGTSRIWDAETPPQLAAWQQEEQAGEKLVAARKADLEKRDQARQKVRDRQDAAIAKARAEGAALRGDPVRQASDPGAIKQWLVLAPIRAEGRDSETRLEEDQLPDEAQLRPHPDETVIVVGNYDGPVERVWTAVRQDDYRLDLKKIVADPVNHNVGYLVTYIVSETNRTGLLMNVGSDYHAKIYLNGRPVHERRNPTSFAPDRDQVKGVALQAELNVLVFKIVQSGPAWGGSVWITEADGRPVPGLRVTLDPDGNR